jgi:hypothetical protein
MYEIRQLNKQINFAKRGTYHHRILLRKSLSMFLSSDTIHNFQCLCHVRDVPTLLDIML